MMMFLMMSIMATTWTMLSMNNPMSLSLTTMLMATLTSLLFSLTVSSWYALILLLIYVGGMMVMFSYFVSLSSNDSMMLKSKMHFIALPPILFNNQNTQMKTPTYLKAQINELYMPKNTALLLLITMILLMVMIIVIKMVKMECGPLRGFNMHQY